MLKKNTIIVLASIVIFQSFSASNSFASKPKCSKSIKAKYDKAYYQYILRNTQIQLSKDIKAIVEDSRVKKSNLLGRYVDYTAKDIYTLQSQDRNIEKNEIERDEWEPEVRGLAKKCKLPVPSRSELTPEYYENE